MYAYSVKSRIHAYTCLKIKQNQIIDSGILCNMKKEAGRLRKKWM